MGAHPTPLRHDPAYEKYYKYNKYRYRYFRLTPRSAWIGLCYAAFFPAALCYQFSVTDGKWDMRGKLRGDPISEW